MMVPQQLVTGRATAQATAQSWVQVGLRAGAYGATYSVTCAPIAALLAVGAGHSSFIRVESGIPAPMHNEGFVVSQSTATEYQGVS